MAELPKFVDVTEKEVGSLLERAKARLEPNDYERIEDVVQSYGKLTRLVREQDTTMARLRRLFGFGKSEKTAAVLDPGDAGSGPATGDSSAAGTENPAPAPSEGEVIGSGASPPEPQPDPGSGGGSKPKRKGHGRVPASDYANATHIPAPHPSLCSGNRCPDCACGNLYQLPDPARFVRIFGQSPLAASCWECERLRCSACGEVYTAPAPAEAQGPKYDDTAASMMALLRYGAGVPNYRLDRLQRNLGVPVPYGTQWEVLDERSAVIRPALDALVRCAAQGSIVHNDDSHMRILAYMGKRRAQLLKRGELKDVERTGLFVTGIVSIADGHQIALFRTGRKHAGENLAWLLEKRAAARKPPILMCDALDRNLPKGHPVVESNCVAHGRRQFVDQVENFPAEVRYLLEMIGRVYAVEEQCKSQGLSDDDRLRAHQTQSGPVMDALKPWMKALLDEKRVEPNSAMGKAIQYMVKRWDKMTLFLRMPGAAIDNNICERILKLAISHRKNSMFYKTAHGAEVGDLYMTLIHTAILNGANPFDYLTELQRNAKAVAESPNDWLPWNYRDTLARMAKAEAPPGAVPCGFASKKPQQTSLPS